MIAILPRRFGEILSRDKNRVNVQVLAARAKDYSCTRKNPMGIIAV